MYKTKLQNDIQFGQNKELEILPIIKKYFHDENIKHNNNWYCFYDYISENRIFELKSRNNTKDRYKTTMVGYNKILEANNYEGEYYILFCFTDGLYYIKYDTELFKTFEVGDGGRNDRGKKEIKKYIFIPTEKLIEIKNI